MNYKKTILIGLLMTSMATQAVAPSTLDTAKKYGLATLYAGGTALTGLAVIGSILSGVHQLGIDKDVIKNAAQNAYSFEKTADVAGKISVGAMNLSLFSFFTYFNARLALYCAKKAKETLAKK